MTVDVVVSRYREPLDWLSALPASWRVFVYDKSGDDAPPFATPLPNVGREAHTFCHHNATAVEPAGYTIYLQGNPFDHCPNLVEQAEFLMTRGDRVGWLGPHYDTAWNVEPHTVASLGTAEVWGRLFPGRPAPSRFAFPAGAQMVVWRDNILARGRAWWQAALGVATTDDWRVAHCFERLWPTIYGGLE